MNIRILIISIFFLLPSIGLAVTDSVNVNISVTGGGGGGPSIVNGCTDSGAINYNPAATNDDGSCLYTSTSTIPNATNFVALYQSQNNRVSLNWVNPVFSGFNGVRIMRKAGSISTSPNEGTLIYEGLNQSFFDLNITASTTYYYTLFVKDLSNNFSSGVVTFSIIPPSDTPPDDDPPPEEEPPDDIPPDDDPPPEEEIPPDDDDDDFFDDDDLPGGGSGEEEDDFDFIDPFDDFPLVENQDPIINQLSFNDFIFVQPGERQQIFRSDYRINLIKGKETSIYVPYSIFPYELKTIGVTVVRTDDPSQSFSFLLRADEDKNYYTATLGPFLEAGTFRIYIHIINYGDQTIKRLEGWLVVGDGVNVANFVSQIVSPLSIGTGLAAGLIQTAVITSGVASLADIYLIILRTIAALLGYIGIKRRAKPWGTVYDSVTKRPIDPAYVSVVKVDNKDEEISSAITDIDGRYGFFLPTGEYIITANKTHYVFPSQKLAGRNADELYDNLYFGEPFKTQGEEVVNYNIPLDPVGFDWNEFVKGQSEFFKVYSQKELRRFRLLNTIYGIGFLAAIFSVIVGPSWLNISVLGLYGLITVFQLVWHYNHKAVKIIRNGQPIPFAIIRLFLADVNQEIKSVVADHLGRFYVLVRPGDYYLTVEEKGSDGSYIKVFQSDQFKLKKGVLREDILI